MKQFCLMILAFISWFSSFSQEEDNQISTKNNFEIIFNTVKPSFEEANKAIMKLNYIDSLKVFNIKFIVPNYCYRYMTTLNDYFIIQTKNKSYRFYNSINSLPDNNHKIFDVMVIGEYVFETKISSDFLKNILDESFRKIEFIFSPNNKIEEGIQKIKKNERLDGLEKHMISLSKRSIKITIKYPDIIQLSNLKKMIGDTKE